MTRPPTSTSSLSLGPACLPGKLWLQCRVTVLLPSHPRAAQSCLPGWDPWKVASRGGGAQLCSSGNCTETSSARPSLLPAHALTTTPGRRFLCRGPVVQPWALGIHLHLHLHPGRGHRSHRGAVAPASGKYLDSYGPGGRDCPWVATSLSHSWKQQVFSSRGLARGPPECLLFAVVYLCSY